MSAHRAKIFVSYRRSDIGPHVRSVSNILMQAFGANTVFFDFDTITSGDVWPQRIDDAVRQADVFVVAIGPGWLKASDEYGRRRLDNPKDWVRKEIETAIDRQAVIVPVLFQGAELPKSEALPDSLVRLLEHQAYQIADSFWQRDVSGLLALLKTHGCRQKSVAVQYPKPRAFPERLSQAQLDAALQLLPGWELVTSTIPGREAEQQTELVRSYRFRRFEDVPRFMNDAVPYIANANHHPRWENVFRSLVVGLTSFDIGFFPSHLDLELAQYLDALFADYERRGVPRAAVASDSPANGVVPADASRVPRQ